MYKTITLTIAIIVLAFTVGMGQGKWESKINENGIEIFTRKPATGNLKELRVLCELACTKPELIKTLQDIANYHNWVYSTKSTEMLKTVSPQQMVYYSVSRLPWPLKDRDLIVELTILPGTGDDSFQIQAKSIPDYLPKKPDLIRVPYSSALWRVNIINEHLLKIDYTFSVDPGGSIPSWLVNSTITIGPYNSFIKLKETLAASK